MNIESSLNSGVVLAVDDSMESLALLNEALTEQGYTVLIAMDGKQAISIAQKMPPDLILLDAVMPDMDGFTTCKTLKTIPELEEIPVIFMTGLSDQSHLLEGLQAGGVDYLTKPVNLDELLLRARTHMANGQKTRLARSALNAMGVATLICDVHGDLRWQSEQAEALFEQLGQTAYQRVRQSLQQWLQHGPEKNMQLSVPLMTAKTAMDKDMPGQETAPSVTESLQLRMIGRPSPSDYLVRLVDNSDLALQQVLRSEFALTDREAEVLLWISRGKTNREIAQILNLSPRTINKHLEPIFRKLGVENRTSAAAASLQALPVQ